MPKVKITVYKISVDKMIVDKMFVDEMPFCLHEKLLYTVEEVSVGEMNVDKMPCCLLNSIFQSFIRIVITMSNKHGVSWHSQNFLRSFLQQGLPFQRCLPLFYLPFWSWTYFNCKLFVISFVSFVKHWFFDITCATGRKRFFWNSYIWRN